MRGLTHVFRILWKKFSTLIFVNADDDDIVNGIFFAKFELYRSSGICSNFKTYIAPSTLLASHHKN